MAVKALLCGLVLGHQPGASAALPGDPFAEGPALASGRRPASFRDDQDGQVRLSGQIYAMGGRNPVPSARVAVVGAKWVADTDARGRFVLDLPPGTHRLLVRAAGYSAWQGSVNLEPGKDTEIELRLLPSPESGVYRTVVEDRREVAVSRTTLRHEEIHDAPGSLGDPFRVVNSLPGVAPLAGFLPYVVVRGAAPGNTGYYLDGVRVPLVFHLAIGPSVIHPYFIDAVDFYPGGAPVRLGRYVSGIIEGRTRPANRDRVRGDVELRLTDVGGLVEVPLFRPRIPGCRPRAHPRCHRGKARSSLAVAGRYSYAGLILSLVQSEVNIQYWDYQARFDHRIRPKLQYTAFAYGSYDSIVPKPYTDEETGERVEPDPLLRFQFHRFDQRVRQGLPHGGAVTYGVALGLDQTGFDDSRLYEWRVAPRITFRIPLGPRSQLGIGLDEEVQIFRSPEIQSSPGAQESLAFLFNERVVAATGVWIDLRWQQGVVEVRPGIRLDHYAQWGPSPYVPSARSLTHALGVDPRLLVRERVGRRVTLRQAVGIYHQPPASPIPIPGIESFGFEYGLQRNIQGSFGYELDLLSSRLELVQEVYLGYLSNLQDYDQARATEGEFNDLEELLQFVDGWTYGLETLVRLDPSLKAFGWLAYTLARSTRKYPVTGHAPSGWDQRHIVNLMLGYKIGHKWNLGGRVHFHTGRPWTSPQSGQLLNEALLENRNNARLPPFFQLDLRIQRNWIFKKWELQGIVEVVNATYSREVLQCSVRDNPRAASAMPGAGGTQPCVPTGFRYAVPNLALRGRF